MASWFLPLLFDIRLINALRRRHLPKILAKTTRPSPNVNFNHSHHPRLHPPSPLMPFKNAFRFRNLSTRNDGEIKKYLQFVHSGFNWRPPMKESRR